jgi:hypothetical protein
MWRATRNAESATQSVARMRSHAERGNEGQSAIPVPGARSLRTRAASLRSGGGSVARQTVLAEQHPCSVGPPRVRPPGYESQHEETKVLTRKAHNLRRRDYMDTCPTNQGGLAGMAGAVTSYEINTYNTRARNPFSRRPRPLWCRRPAGLFGAVPACCLTLRVLVNNMPVFPIGDGLHWHPGQDAMFCSELSKSDAPDSRKHAYSAHSEPGQQHIHLSTC